jgi:serine/threonine protein phosphatase PrpC
MRGKMDAYGLSDVGKVRSVNEDQFLIGDLSRSMLIHQTTLDHEEHSRLFGGSQGQLLLVADGMGGHAAGKRASTIAVDTLAHYVLNTMSWFLRLQESQEDDLEEEFKAALARCQKQIEVQASASSESRGMGTTLTMAYVLWPRFYVVHAGDSRCYLLRDGRLEQVTTDQTMAQQLVDRGALSPEEAKGSRWSHVLWNCIGGGSPELSVDVYKGTLQIGDTLLLCTDGLTARVRDEQILEVLTHSTSAEEASRQLVNAANETGAPDNVTVVVAHFRDANELKAQARQQASLEEEVGTLAPRAGRQPEPEVLKAV